MARQLLLDTGRIQEWAGRLFIAPGKMSLLTRKIVYSAAIRRTAQIPALNSTCERQRCRPSKCCASAPALPLLPRRPIDIPLRPFASMPAKKSDDSQILEIPSNLIFHPKAKSSPFYGADRVGKSESSKPTDAAQVEAATQLDDAVSPDDSGEPSGSSSSEDKGAPNVVEESAEKSAASASLEGEVGNAEDDYDEDHDEYDSEEEDEEEERVLFDLSTMQDVPRAIPLPQRLHVSVLDIKSAEEVGTFHLSPQTFGCSPVRVDILQRCVVWQRNKKRGRRNPGAITKTINTKRGSGRKVRPQKGGGTSRAGHRRPPHWRGGAKAHGPKGKIQDYTTKLNKKVRKMGVRHALSQKLLEGNLIVTSDLASPSHKTRELNEMLDRFDVGKGADSALFIDDAKPEDAEDESTVYGGVDVNLRVASGNIPRIKVLNQIACNVYDMLKYKKLFLSLSAVGSLEARLEKDLK